MLDTPVRKEVLKMSNQTMNSRNKKSILFVIFLIIALLLPTFIAFNSYSNDSNFNDKTDGTQFHRDLGVSYMKDGKPDKAIKEFEKAMELSYKEGYNKGKEDSINQATKKVYLKYIILSVLSGLYFSAIILIILLWADISSQAKSFRSGFKISGQVKRINTKLSSELYDKAIEIIKSKEKLRDAINKENDLELNGIASSILPRLDELVRQALLLIERMQILSDYIKDIDSSKLQDSIRDCEEKFRTEKDQEAKDALEYQLTQTKNKQNNYNKAKARIRTFDAVLKGISSRIDATSLDLMSLPSVLMKKQEFFERVSAELDEEIGLTKKATETVMEEAI